MNHVKMRISAFLAAFMAFSILSGCAGRPTDTVTVSDIPSVASDTTSQETSAREASNLPDTYDLEGYEFRVIKMRQEKNPCSLNTFGVIEANGEVLNDVFYERNQKICEKYNFIFKETEIDKSPVSTIRSAVLAGDDEYDIALIPLFSERSSSDGTYCNLYELPNLDLTKSWWNQSLIKGMTVNGKLYYIGGDVIASDDDGLMINVYNKGIGEDYGFENLYDTVRSGGWTYDKKLSLMKQVASDLDNNGVYDTNDCFGMLYADNAAAYPYFASTGTYLFTRGSDSTDFTANSERANTVYEKIQGILSDKTIAFDWSNIKTNSSETIVGMLDKKQVLFLDIGLHFVRRNLRDLKTDYAILPMPKLDEAQDKYYNMINESMNYIFVPSSVTNPDKTGFILEALAGASGSITNTYYKTCIEGKYARDAESIEMLGIASENIVFDFGFIYNWGNLGTSIRDGIMADTSYSSMIATYESAAKAEMELFFKKQQ